MTPDRSALTADVLAAVSAWVGAEPQAGRETRNDPWHTAVHEADYVVEGRKLGLDMRQASAAPDGDSTRHSLAGDPYTPRWTDGGGSGATGAISGP